MKNIILVGMMSSGKSTLGKKLARYLGYRFVDLDKLIEHDQGMDIPSLFSQKGETYFREIESRILKQTIPNNRLVLASGGGTPCFYDNMDFIKNSGVSVFLDVPASELARRIENHGKDDRPILSGATSIEAELTKKIEERRPYYAQADVTIEGKTEVTELVEAISSFL
ncbi:shikimate kinase [Dyadobacter psychrotolerans]|uniref:Shikimate kinase n=1 Tax=Dyadobacter psychrotolerans TaxID=2541721 RepID=A0A4R5DXP4_9BACT|nr:shikimate kinase [Dyadobacter psychrotolerans]TDE17434.1 shikimate kinase [Dyadobacter psychrotolerans]